MNSRFFKLALVFLSVMAFSLNAKAQFKKEAFKQSYLDARDTTGRDSTDALFTFKEYFGGLSHKRDERIGVLFAGSTVFIGGEQIYNRQYWKLPIIYGGIGAGLGLGFAYRNKWKNTGLSKFHEMSNWFFAGAGLVYWGALMDGVINYKKDTYPQAGKATLYSILLPGLGQAYNGEFWKIPIYYGFMVGSLHFLLTNNKNYHRYKWIHNMATDKNSTYDGPISAETALYYRDVFRRYRDYSIVALAGFYLLQVIDANVFSYMQDFELSDDISLNISPTVITSEPVYTLNSYGNSFANTGLHYSGSPVAEGFGLRIGFTF